MNGEIIVLVGLVENTGAHEHLGDQIGIAVGGRSTILEESLAILNTISRYTTTRASIGHARREVGQDLELFTARQSTLVVLATVRVIHLNVFDVSTTQLVDGVVNLLDAALGAHLLRREVRARTAAVPLARHRLRVERHRDAKLLGDALQNVTAHPQVIACLDASQRAHLELPLRRHRLGVGARDLNACVQTCL